MTKFIDTTTAFEELIEYYKKIPAVEGRKIKMEYLKEFLKPYAIRMSNKIQTDFPKTGARRYSKGKPRTTTGRLSAVAKKKTSRPHAKKTDDGVFIGYFYVPKSGVNIQKSKKNSALRPETHIYMAWIENGTKTHTIKRNDIRPANIISRIDYYQRRIYDINERIAQISMKGKAKGKRLQKLYEIKAQKEKRYRELLADSKNLRAKQNGKFSTGIKNKWNYIHTIRNTINHAENQRLSATIVQDLKNYIEGHPTFYGKKLSK